MLDERADDQKCGIGASVRKKTFTDELRPGGFRSCRNPSTEILCRRKPYNIYNPKLDRSSTRLSKIHQAAMRRLISVS